MIHLPDRLPERESARRERTRVRILEMIVRTEPVRDVLNTIVEEMSAASPAGVAILIVRGFHLEAAAKRGLTDAELTMLQQLPLARLVDAEADCYGWHPAGNLLVRGLVSGAGEMLGAIAIPSDPKAADLPRFPEEFETLESLAAFAIEHENLLAELTWRAEHDSLTELCNRQWFERKLAVRKFELRRKPASFAVLSLNIDRFSLINDVLGYRVGNRLLREVAARLQTNIGPDDFIARAGGNEFLFLIAHAGSTEEACAAGERLLSSLRQPFLIDDHELFVSASIGITIVSAEDSAADEPESRAWAAMTNAKMRGRNQIALFDLSMLQNSRERLEIGFRLRNAIANGELELHYQPQVDLATGAIIGAEALLRWRHAAIGFVSPGTFIPVAEESGLITNFGEWTIAEAIRQGTAWKRAGLEPLRIAVNISPVHFMREDFASRLRELLRHFDTDSFALELEIIETAVMQDLDHARAVMQDLGTAGVAFAIDDFGTGHSSLAWLQKLPVQRLKIAQNFVNEISSAVTRPTLLANIIRLAREMHLACLAEGVETGEQALALAAMGCDEAQGFLYSRPVNAADLGRLLGEGLVADVALAGQRG